MTTKNNNKATKSPSKLGSFLKSDKLRYAVAVFLAVFGVYLLIAFVSFLFHGAFDQSELNTPATTESAEPTIQNNAGQNGAALAHFFINRGFGIASFVYIFILTVVVFRLFRISYFSFWKDLCLSFLGILWISITLGLIIPTSTDSFHVAGNTGLYLANFAHAKFGFIGSLLLLFGILMITLIFAFNQFVPWIAQKKVSLIDEKIAARKQRAEMEKLQTNDAHNDAEEKLEKTTTPSDELDQFEPLKKTIENISPIEHDEFEDNSRINLTQVASDKDKELRVEDNLDSEIDPFDNHSPVSIFTLDDEDENEDFDNDFDNTQQFNPAAHVESREIEDQDGNVGMIVNKQKEEEWIAPENHVANFTADYDPTLDLSNYKFPSVDLLEEHQGEKHDVTEDELIENKNKIVETLSHYKIEIVKIQATIGPTITLYEIIPAPGTRVNKIKNLEDDIALSLAALGVRIIAPMPGKGTIGIEVPNKKPEVVSMRSIVASKKFQESKADLPVVMGKTISNETFVFDLAKMPHLLVAGATGQGKSVGLNAIITSLLYKKHPSQLKMVMVDPKMVELNIYGVIEKHFLAKLPDADKPIITDVDKVKNTLNSLTIEMDDRYRLLMKANTRNIKEYNTKFVERKLNPNNGHKYLPYIVVVVDEFADLIMTAGKEIETPIARIAQKARAVGIHMIIATQRPSTNIITGVIKANFPGRIAFRVASMIDSRTILDSPGANQLIGKGDMLFMQGSDMIRLQCAFVDTPEVERVCDYISNQQGYPSAFLLPEYVPEGDGNGGTDVDLNQRDELFDEVARMVVSNQMGSTSMIQRKFAIGYNRAGRIMDQLEAAGVVGPSEGSKPRQVLMQDDYALEQLINNL